MRTCSNCGAEIGDNNAFCVKCGTPVGTADNNANQQFNAGPNEGQQQSNNQQFNAGPQQNYQQNYQQNPQYVMRPNYDHTAEFDAKDVSENKVLALFCYLDFTFGIIGVIIAFLGSGDSKFGAFHAKQALKITVVQMLLSLCVGILFGVVAVIGLAFGMSFNALMTMIAVFSYILGAGYLVLFVVRIILFFQACAGKSVEPVIIRSFGFLR